MGSFSKVESFDAEGLVVRDFVPRRWKKVSWDRVLFLRSQDQGRWWFLQESDGRVRRVPAGSKKLWSAAREAWLAAIEAQTAESEVLEGACLPPSLETRWMRWQVLLFAFALGPVIFLWLGYKAVWKPAIAVPLWDSETRLLILACIWVAIVLLVAMFGLVWGLIAHSLLVSHRYRRWRIDRTGLHRQPAGDTTWLPVPLLGSEGRFDPAIPWQSFTTPEVVQRLFVVLLDRMGKAFPPPARRLDVTVRLAFVWPAILLLVVSLPPLAIGAPEPVTGSLLRTSAWLFGLGICGAALVFVEDLLVFPKARREYQELIEKACRLRGRLGW